jgi:hypothetical protein
MRGVAPAAAALMVLSATAWLQAQSAGSGVLALRCDRVTFLEVAAAAGIDFVHDRGDSGQKHLPESMGAGLAWLDFDGDGWTDLYLVQSGPFPPDGSPGARDRLWRNRGDGTFEEVTAMAQLREDGCGQGVLAADLNGDGSGDLYVTNFGRDALWHNRGDGSFEEVGRRSGLDLDGWSSSAAAADFDGDRDLDLYVTRYLEYQPADPLFCGDLETGARDYCDPSLFDGASDRLFRNRGDGTFEDSRLTDSLGGGARGKGLGVVSVDLDRDGWADIYVANDITPNFLFANRGDGTFEDLSLLSGAAASRQGKMEAGMGLAVGDIDADGDPDILVTNFDVETNTAYRNLGNHQFEDASAELGFGPPSFNLLGFGIALADFDLDGALDAYVTNGHIFERPKRKNVRYAQPDLLMMGDGRGGFLDAGCEWLVRAFQVGRGLAASDYDNDGDLDLAINNNGGAFQLRRNEQRGGRWLGVRLVGSGANTEAVGARVELLSATRPRQARWVMAGDSYQSSSDRRLLFGLGSAEAAALEVTWPSGHRRRLLRPPRGRYLVVYGPPVELAASSSR